MSIQVTPDLVTPSADDAGVPASGGGAYLSALLNQCQQKSVVELSWLQDLRLCASDWVAQQSFPTTRDEEWRFTNLSALKQVNFQAVSTTSTPNIEPLTLPEAANSRLVFINGVYAPELSAANLPDGVIVANLETLTPAVRSHLQNYLAQAPGSQEVFTALNTAGIHDVAVVLIPKNLVVETPIHLLYIATSETPTITQPRCLIVAETGGSATIIEEYYSTPTSFTNTVTEIWIAENAQVNHTRIEHEDLEAFHIGKTCVVQARDSRYTSNAITLGAQLSRHNLEIHQTGEQTETILNGLTMIAGNQLADTHSVIALNYPHGTSRQLHKCIVGDRAHAVFNGKIFVPKPAQLTDAAQLNRNLLLSPKARVDTKPQLEITADNVKCAHGATVSQLDDDEVFYLQSRGLDANTARNLLINAFATEIINQVPIPSLKAALTTTINKPAT